MGAEGPVQSVWRRGVVGLALVALALRILIPAGFMPGTSLTQPIVLCPDQGPMPSMSAHHGHHEDPAGAPHGKRDHPCAFAGLGAPPILSGPGALPPAPTVAPDTQTPPPPHTAAPGRGMAAPPPPSHGPPFSRA